ncbi:MAG: hypothetical protein AB7T63_05110 [Planctomycetota bacterium]
MPKRAARLQYTIRGVPPSVDRALRARARREGRSLNDVAVEALRRSVGEEAGAVVHTDLDVFLGTWVEDPELDAALEEQGRGDPSLWA